MEDYKTSTNNAVFGRFFGRFSCRYLDRVAKICSGQEGGVDPSAYHGSYVTCAALISWRFKLDSRPVLSARSAERKTGSI
jgi:hypothetical protein